MVGRVEIRRTGWKTGGGVAVWQDGGGENRVEIWSRIEIGVELGQGDENKVEVKVGVGKGGVN